MRFKLLCLLFSFATLISCKENPLYNEIEIIESFADTKYNEIDYLVIIPVSGCGDCIEDTLKYMKSNYKNIKLKFILVESSNKVINNLFLDNEEIRNHVLIDKKKILQSKNILNVKPVVYSFSEGLVTQKSSIQKENVDEILNKIKQKVK